MYRDAEGFHVVLPVKAQRYRRLLHVVWLAVWLLGEVALVASIAGWSALPAPPLPILLAFTAVFTAAGAFKQRLYIIPARRMVVVRFGNSVGPQFDDARFLGLLLGSIRE
jgi:CubicO group peptidase (beta-lactamase class C family)